MRYLCLLFIAACTASLSSCSDAEEPISPLIGAWENREYVDSLNYWIVERYDFVNDSTYDINVTVRETEGGEDLGYRFITRGWYDYKGEDFTYYYADVLMIEDYFLREGNELFAPKDDLRAVIVDFFREPTASLTFSSDRKQFVFQDECLEYVDECPVAKTYVRVN
ncbi:hypothetical protein [Algoriphagus aquimarinus]|uniref:hypothetical protein n=1 Tax=Algoriphagus aquimarinus TaxID=237018 RepID=UPI0030D92B66|tara:strand:+ start:3485 stop:3982 length:498 start_codon:yes stop_codon:yes gene_type:complete